MSPLPSAPRIAVVGAGWAGLAAGVALHRLGAQVTVLEAGHTPGGRARRAQTDPAFAAPLDNGQHILLGAYSDTLALMRELGCDPAQLLHRLPLRLQRLDGQFALRAPRLPAPLHAALALLGAHGLSWSERLASARMVQALRRQSWRPDTDTVGALLRAHRQPERLVQWLWRPLCLAALNTAPDEACARLFCAVLRDSLDARREASDLLLPTADLSALWPDAAAARLHVRYGSPVRQLAPLDDGVHVANEHYAAVVLAVPPEAALRLLSGLPQAQALCRTLAAYDSRPIATLTLRVAGKVSLPAPIVMLDDNPAAARHGQWLFDRSALLGLPGPETELTVVASDAAALAALPRAEASAAMLAQLRAELPLPPVLAHRLIIDKRATFAATPGLVRAGTTTAWPRIVLAGDWTETGYPGVLEGAVRSGQAAARALWQALAGSP